MNDSQFVQEHPQQHYGAPPTLQQQNGQHNPTSDNLSYNRDEGQFNDQFSQLGLNSESSFPSVQSNTYASNNINNFPNGPQTNNPQVYAQSNFLVEQSGLPKQFSSAEPYGGDFNQNVPPPNSFKENSNNIAPLSSSFLENSNQSNSNDEISNIDSRELINCIPGSLNEVPISSKSNAFNSSSVVQNQFGPGLNSLSQQPHSAFSVVSSQSREYLGNTGLPSLQQSNFPPKSKVSAQHLDFSPQSNLAQQQPGFPPQPNSTLQQQGFPPKSNLTSQQSSFPPQPISTLQQSGFPPKSNSTSQQPGFPPLTTSTSQQLGLSSKPNSTQHQSGFPPQSNSMPQQPGFPPQSISASQQSGFDPQPNSMSQKPGFPPQPSSTTTLPGFLPQPNSMSQQPGFPPPPTSTLQQSGFPPQSNSTFQQPGFPLKPNPTLQQPGFPPQSNSISQQPGFPPQPNLTLQQPGFPSQPSLTPQQPGFPPQFNTFSPPQQQGFPTQSGSLPSQPIGFPPQQTGFPPQQPGLVPQQLGLSPQQTQLPQQPGYTQQYNGFPQQPNYPPQQSYTTQQPGLNQGTPTYMGQPAPSRRLDPEQMPSPVQVIQDDQQSKGGIFLTNQRGLVPPLVTTDFTVQDGGNASPRLIRSTMYCVPTTTDIMKQSSVPFGLVISPIARIKQDEYPPPIINTGEMGPVRCKRCKAYMSPFMQFIDGGKHFICLLCKTSTEVPVEYFQHLDHTGQRLDRFERPELCFGSYEFIVPKEYCRKETQPKPPAYIFVIDVSYNNIKSGLVRLICAFMKELLSKLPTELGEEKSKIRVGFITYDTTVHFYNIKETLVLPQVMVVGDTTEMFVPLLDGFLCNPEKSSHVIDALMDIIPSMFNETRTTETILLPAITAGMEALKKADCCGKLFVFHSSLPIAEAPGKLKNREDRKLLATDKEKTILNPQTNVYMDLGQECVQVGCSVDLFITNNSFIDLATIGEITKITGGEIFKYTYFQADIDGERFLSDLKRAISRPTVFDAVMRVRTSTGTRPTDFYGHFFMSNSTDVELAAIDCDKAIAIEVKHDDKLDEQDGVLVQTAILYTSCSGQRRVRILNLALQSSGQMSELYRSCDLDTIINFFGKQVMYKILESSGHRVKDAITNKAAQILATYRKHCASPSSVGQLILPECMKLMPLYVNCIIKSDAMSGGSDMTVDDRWYNMHLVITSDIPTTLGYFYPRLIPIHTLNDETPLDCVSIPEQLRCSIEKFSENGAFVLENGVYMFMWLGLGLSQTFLSDVFGVQNIAHVDTECSTIPILDNPLNKAVRQVLFKIQEERSHSMRLSIIRQRDKIETVMRHFLVEDHGIDNSPSYVEFLCRMHKVIRDMLS
ncbi:Sec23/Sec24, trunk domain,Sec23/Sec24 beta-sandwich,ADF-H/Gelsolin-like domain,Zinc finger [Cinara cedri]|uniref:Sec23/Sec24, trunk domain,Sec23/Sec24 beta-sandwich,ADF-H/Gelsolin-like domain,Zinc finger n=1 Tax=Cinara cedri TaxID=506608 RepID=A0A5E4N2S1_9HEMI|nr:Sec23/Sec24, trunk domain,Sec23/Sec24 beta-sandwich,ADF-H/Gelsolin-like domain,Zinc finger [Cinara cedri]